MRSRRASGPEARRTLRRRRGSRRSLATERGGGRRCPQSTAPGDVRRIRRARAARRARHPPTNCCKRRFARRVKARRTDRRLQFPLRSIAVSPGLRAFATHSTLRARPRDCFPLRPTRSNLPPPRGAARRFACRRTESRGTDVLRRAYGFGRARGCRSRHPRRKRRSSSWRRKLRRLARARARPVLSKQVRKTFFVLPLSLSKGQDNTVKSDNGFIGGANRGRVAARSAVPGFRRRSWET